jgi:hypothetical protein
MKDTNGNYSSINIILIAVILGGLSGLGFAVGYAQETLSQKPGRGAAATATATPTPKPAVAPDTMALTAEEIRDIEYLTAEMRPLIQEANSTYQKLIGAKTAEERYKAADQHWIAAKQLEPLQEKQLKWLSEVRKAHNCPDCLVQGNRLVAPPQQAQPQQAQPQQASAPQK